MDSWQICSWEEYKAWMAREAEAEMDAEMEQAYRQWVSIQQAEDSANQDAIHYGLF